MCIHRPPRLGVQEFSVFLSGLDNSLNDTEAKFALQNFLTRCGLILHSRVHARTNQKGLCAFVELHSAESVEQALLLDGTELGGRTVQVELAKTSQRILN